MRNLCVALLTLGVAAAAIAQQDFSAVEIKVHKIAGSIYMLEGAGGNIGVSVGEDGIILVDDQYAPLAPKIKAALKGITNKPVRFVLNTHYHGDHTGGNEAFGETAPIIAHSNVRTRLMEGTSRTPAAPKGALPVITFDESLSIHLNGETVRAIHFPAGHTDGDAVIYFTKSNVVHMGDNFFSGRFPFIDLDSGGSVRGLAKNIDRIIGELSPDVKLIPGHGPAATLDDLRKYQAMLHESIELVERGIAAGKSLDDLKSEKVLAKYDALSWNFISTDRFITTIHTELTASRPLAQ
jgi:cyclase